MSAIFNVFIKVLSIKSLKIFETIWDEILEKNRFLKKTFALLSSYIMRRVLTSKFVREGICYIT